MVYPGFGRARVKQQRCCNWNYSGPGLESLKLAWDGRKLYHGGSGTGTRNAIRAMAPVYTVYTEPVRCIPSSECNSKIHIHETFHPFRIFCTAFVVAFCFFVFIIIVFIINIKISNIYFFFFRFLQSHPPWQAINR